MATLGRHATVFAAAGAVAALGLSWAATASAAVQRPAAGHQGFRAPARLTRGFARPALPAGEHYACAAATRPGQMTCDSIIDTNSRLSAASPSARNSFYGPSDLRRAYKLAAAATRAGKGRLVAIVDAFNNPDLASNLARYRAHFGLPPCRTSSGCLKIVNEKGKTGPLPAANANWGVEESLDLDMVSAICPKCHILLVEARVPSTVALGTAEDTAARAARYVSNSWSGGEFTGQDFFDHYFNHPGDVIDFASGDFGYGPQYPTDLQYVTAIGGTTLRHASGGRGWSESAWGSSSGVNGTGSGCSLLEAKASWQVADAKQPDGCLNRTENDVSAVANPATGVAVYDTFKQGGFFDVGGTSAATPIITSVYALAGKPTAHTYPAEYPYLHHSHLFDAVGGVNGKCESFRQYLCHGVPGYDGPTGLGTPNGTGAFTDHGAHRVTVIDPGTQDEPRGATVKVNITGLDTRSASLTWSASGLPAGLTIKPRPHSTDAVISGVLSGAPGDFSVAVTAKDGTASGTTHFDIAVVPSLSLAASAAGEVVLNHGSKCLDANGATSGSSVKVTTCGATSSQLWRYTASGKPNSTGKLTINSLCLGIKASKAQLQTCSGAQDQAWVYVGFGLLGNLGDGKCLAAANSTSGAQVQVARCTFIGGKQVWWLPGGPIVAGVGLCLTNATTVQVVTCSNSAAQQWSLEGNGTIRSNTGRCLSVNNSPYSGTTVVAAVCDSTGSNPDLSELWRTGPDGQLMSDLSARCLADPGDGGSGTTLTQEDCYRHLGELWGLN